MKSGHAADCKPPDAIPQTIHIYFQLKSINKIKLVDFAVQVKNEHNQESVVVSRQEANP